MKKFLNSLVEKYENEDFIKNDPIKFPHRYKNPEEIELIGFLSSLFAYGQRTVFIKKLEELFNVMGEHPIEFILNCNDDFECLNNFYYRVTKSEDIRSVLYVLKQIYKKESLKTVFKKGYEETKSVKGMLNYVSSYFYVNSLNPPSKGFKHLIPNPKNNSPLKRMNMYLRWMVRKSKVDFGIWDFIEPKDLIIPFDTHVANVSRELGLLKRKSNDFKAVEELMAKLREFDEIDPVKYDFALFSVGIEKRAN